MATTLKIPDEELREAYAKLEEARDYYFDLYEHSPVGYITLNADGLITAINQTGAQLLGIDRAKSTFDYFLQHVAPNDRDRWNYLYAELKERTENVRVAELEMMRPDGSTFYAYLDCLPWNGEVSHSMLRIALIDISERKRVEDALREQEEFFRLIAENGEDFIAVLDLEGRRRYNNRAYAKIFGNVAALKGTDSFAEIHPEDQDRIKKVFMDTVHSGIGHRAEYRFMLANGDIRYMESCGGLIKNSKGEASCVVVVSRDITERKEAEGEILSLAFHDTLTGLPNRRLLEDRVGLAMAASKRSNCYGAVMFLDLDNFKPLNDTHGHAVGDLLLIEAANRLKSCLREVDTVARFGGDEFVVLLSELDVDKTESTAQAIFVAEKIRAKLAEPYILKVIQEGKAEATVEHHCTATIGVVLFIGHEATREYIFECADSAMYQAKKSGRNLVRLYES